MREWVSGSGVDDYCRRLDRIWCVEKRKGKVEGGRRGEGVWATVQVTGIRNGTELLVSSMAMGTEINRLGELTV